MYYVSGINANKALVDKPSKAIKDYNFQSNTEFCTAAIDERIASAGELYVTQNPDRLHHVTCTRHGVHIRLRDQNHSVGYDQTR
jgi:hypothetical protein